MKNATSRATRVALSSSDGNAGIPKNCIVSEPAVPAQASPSQLLAIFTERCEARALLVAEGLMSLQIAVDQVQQIAVDQELVDHFGQDLVQQIMSDAFKTGGR
jgi:hypothetical protein